MPSSAATRPGITALRWGIGLLVAMTGVAFLAPLGLPETKAVSEGAGVLTGTALLGGFVWARRGSSGTDRIAWTILLTSMAAGLLAYVVDPVQSGMTDDHMPLAFTLGPIMTLLHLAAIGLLLRRTIVGGGAVRLVLDAVWIAVAVLLVTWNLVGNTAIESDLPLMWRTSLVVQQFATALLISVLVLLIHTTRRQDRAAIVAIALPPVLIGIGQSAFGHAFVTGRLDYGNIHDFVITAAFGMGAVAVCSPRSNFSPRARALRPGSGQLVVTWLPLVAWAGTALLVRIAAIPEQNWIGVLVIAIGVIRLSFLATENTHLARTLHLRATLDPLTGLPNRNAVDDLIAELGESAGMLLVDLDRFKAVNDTLGHIAGDELLISVSRRMLGAVDESWMVARLAGDEFLLISSSEGDRDAVHAVGGALIAALSQPFEIQGREVWIGASVGAAATGDDLESHELLPVCDYALRTAKDHAKGEVVTVDAELRTRARDRVSLEAGLERAAENGELFCLYQPKVDLMTGALLGVEALVRWNRPGVGVVPPAEFIPVAEASGLVARLDSWVMREAVADLERWNRLRGPEPRLSLATNMSAWQLARIDVDQEVGRILAAASGVDPSQLTIELTETLLVEDPQVVARRLAKLNDIGLGIAVDDFGAGFTSIAYLRQFPISDVKIDRSLVSELTGGADDDRSLAAAVIALAHAMGLDVVAEGVETVVQAESLRRMGCRVAQGYLFAKPLPSEEIDELVQQALPFASLVRASSPVGVEG